MKNYVGTGIFTKNGKELMNLSYEYYLVYKEQYKKIFEKYLEHKENIIGENKLEQCNKMCEKYEKYQVDNKHDKLFKDLFSNKQETAKFISKYLNLKVKIDENEIEPYKTEYITSKYEKKEADIVYKIKEKNIFFLIEHQSTVDRAMPYRIEEYKCKIMEQAINKKKMHQRTYLYPKVIAMVLYTGKANWQVPKTLEEIQEKMWDTMKMMRTIIL